MYVLLILTALFLAALVIGAVMFAAMALWEFIKHLVWLLRGRPEKPKQQKPKQQTPKIVYRTSPMSEQERMLLKMKEENDALREMATYVLLDDLFRRK